MAKNLGMTHGLIVAEAVMMGLAPHTGRNEAHDLVYDACRAAIESDRPLLDVLLETPAVAGPLGPDKLRALTDPANYLGAAPAMVDHVLARAERGPRIPRFAPFALRPHLRRRNRYRPAPQKLKPNPPQQMFQLLHICRIRGGQKQYDGGVTAMNSEEATKSANLRPVAKIIASYVGNHILAPDQLGALIVTVEQTVRRLGMPAPPQSVRPRRYRSSDRCSTITSCASNAASRVRRSGAILAPGTICEPQNTCSVGNCRAIIR